MAPSSDSERGETQTASRVASEVGVIVALMTAVGFLYWAIVRPWYLQWGTTEEDRTRHLPGHDLAPDPAVNNTQAVTIDAPPAAVWPWLVQIGQGRGGFYSYDWLERLFGADIHNVDRIIPEYQDLAVGDEVLLAPKNYWAGSPDSWPVVEALDEERSLVLRPPTDSPTYVWTFFLEPIDNGQTRFIARMRSPRKSTTIGRLLEAITWEPAHFVMQRKMLLRIKELAERHAN